MTNRDNINRLRDMAELSQASYGYFDLIGKKFKDDDKYKDRQGTTISIYDILDINYKGYEAYQNEALFPVKAGVLNGDFTPLQIQNFFNRYDLLKHQENTWSGFSATLFQDNSGI